MNSLKDLEEADKLLERILLELLVSVDLFFDTKLIDVLFGLFDELEYPKFSGSVDVSRAARNMRKINDYRGQIRKSLQSESYAGKVADALRSLDEVVGKYNAYFGLSESPNLKQLWKDSLWMAKESLLGAGMDAVVVNPVIERIYQHNLQGLTRRDLEKEMKAYFESNNMPKRYLQQIVSDTLQQMTAHYKHSVAEGLGLKHYLYAGTGIATTRGFCGARYGKVFTQKEVEGWATQDWNGKIAGTNARNIFVYRGGWNCRHQLQPISELLYQKLKGRNSN